MIAPQINNTSSKSGSRTLGQSNTGSGRALRERIELYEAADPEIVVESWAASLIVCACVGLGCVLWWVYYLCGGDWWAKEQPCLREGSGLKWGVAIVVVVLVVLVVLVVVVVLVVLVEVMRWGVWLGGRGKERSEN